ncbi:unnamed protein product [Fusarium graminearum]|nr:unnamed protein product [Fusarium graminearum]
MCRKFIRWFCCPVQIADPDDLPSIPQRTQPANLLQEWARWRPDDRISPEELSYLRLEHQTYYYIRHKKEYWIRCARSYAVGCDVLPLETRTELYSIPCPDCTRDHASAMSARPFQTHIEEPDADRDVDNLELIYAGYLSETLNHTRAFFMHELDLEPLDELSAMNYLHGLNCTENPYHIRRQHPDRNNFPEECLEDCACTADPGAHNLSRAARNQEAMRVRDKRAYGWFEFIQKDKHLDNYKTRNFVQIPNQLAINLDEESSEKHDRMVERVGQQVMSLCLLDHNPDLETEWTARYDDLEEWQERVRQREAMCLIMIRYAAADPGITMSFADGLMSCILTMLAPGLDETDPSVQHFFCNFPGYEDFAKMTAMCDQLTTGNIIRRNKWNYRQTCMDQQDELLNAMRRNRNISFRNVVNKQRVAEAVAQRFRTPGPALLDTDEVRDCVICSDPFDTSGDKLVPEHLAIVQLPCCTKFIHTRCFKGVTTGKKQACPFCNADLETIGMNPGDGTEFLSFSLRHAELPPGLHRFSTGIEKAIASFIDPNGIALLKKLNRVIEDEEGMPRGTLGAVYRDWHMNAY